MPHRRPRQHEQARPYRQLYAFQRVSQIDLTLPEYGTYVHTEAKALSNACTAVISDPDPCISKLEAIASRPHHPEGGFDGTLLWMRIQPHLIDVGSGGGVIAAAIRSSGHPALS